MHLFYRNFPNKHTTAPRKGTVKQSSQSWTVRVWSNVSNPFNMIEFKQLFKQLCGYNDRTVTCVNGSSIWNGHLGPLLGTS